jgi:hypothetical protein
MMNRKNPSAAHTHTVARLSGLAVQTHLQSGELEADVKCGVDCLVWFDVCTLLSKWGLDNDCDNKYRTCITTCKSN